MKLRNKKTGEVVEAIERGAIDLYFYLNEHEGGTDFDRKTYNSISELNDEWEDYAPKEPLIKQEKIRKAVRAWAEACAVERCHYDGDGDFATRWHGIKLDGSQIELDEGHYTIDELCGEEEE